MTIEKQVGSKSNPVYLSYSNTFTNRVSLLKQALEARGIPCWMAGNDMVGDAAIALAFKAAPAIIICYSRSYHDSKYAYQRNSLQDGNLYYY